MKEKSKYKRQYTIEELEELLDNIPYEVYIKNIDGKYMYANEATVKRIGLTKDEVIGKGDIDLRTPEMAKICMDGDKLVLKNGDKTFIEDKVTNGNIETKYELFKTLLYKNTVDDVRIGGIAKFIIEDKTLCNNVRNNTKVVMNTPKGIDNDGFYKELVNDIKNNNNADDVALYFYNEELSKMHLYNHLGKNEELFKKEYGLTEPLKEKYYGDFEYEVIEDEKVGVIKYIYLLKYNNIILGSLHLLYKDSEVKINDACVRHHCLVLSFTETNRNLTANLNKEFKILHKLKKNKEDLEQAVELESLRSEFFANLSHEFKTPLNIILSTVQLINNYMNINNDYPELDNFNRYLKNIKQNSFRLLKLTNNIIDITKIDSNYYHTCFANYNIVEIVENVVQSCVEYVKGNKRNIIFDTYYEEIITACDPDQIERIILNLLSNAIKFTTIDGNIYVSLETNNCCNKVIIRVRNDGQPVSIEDSTKIFERFIQGENLLTRSSEGSGIGLSIAKSLVEIHKGNIYVNTECKEGTEFCIELPIRKLMNSKENNVREKNIISKVEKFDIEFSDIYD